MLEVAGSEVEQVTVRITILPEFVHVVSTKVYTRVVVIVSGNTVPEVVQMVTIVVSMLVVVTAEGVT